LAETKTKTNTDFTDITTVVTAVDAATSTTTTTTTNNRNTTTCAITEATNNLSEHCHFDLKKLAEESRCAAFRSSNIAAATSNSVVIFTLLVFQELLIKECKKSTLDLNTIFLISNAISNLSASILVTNPQPLNS